MTKTTTTYALPPEPDGPVWDRNGDKWERTGEMLSVHGREWAEWRHVASGNVGTWPAPLMRGPVTSTPPWKPEVGGVCETAEQYAAMPKGSIVARSFTDPYVRGSRPEEDYWFGIGCDDKFSNLYMASFSRTILRVGWGS